jgi:pimaricinolide synthase PimS1
LLLGSMKSNIGHAQAAAGVAGVIKMVQAMRHRTLPRTLHVDRPTSRVDWSAGAVDLLTEERDWPGTADRPVRAGVSSFGISGTNAHVILESAPREPAGEAERTDPPVIPWVLSGRDPEALRAQARGLVDALEAGPAPHPADIGFSLATGRASGFEHRAVLLGGDRPEARRRLALLAAGEAAPGVATGTARERGLAFLFTGQGAQRAGMGQDLYASFPVFADALDEVLARFDRLLEHPLRTVMFAQPGAPQAALLDRTEFAQPALFAFETALFRLLESLGVHPRLVAGHSAGEPAAAHVAGMLSLDDACSLVAARGRLMGRLPAGGAMASINATEAEVAEALADAELIGTAGPVGLAAVNGPEAVVVSGAERAVLAVMASFEARGRRTKRLRVGHAFHSALMEPMLAEFDEAASGVTVRPARVPMLSGVLGEVADAEAVGAPGYWVRHVREPVRFADMVRGAAGLGATAFLDVGPDASLSAMARECLPDDADAVFAPTLRKDRPEAETLMSALAELYVQGTPVDWAEVFAGSGAHRVDLPTYPFRRRRYWLTARPSGGGDPASLGLVPVGHPILRALADTGDGEAVALTGRLSVRAQPWLADHVVAGATVCPGTAFLDMAATAGRQVGRPVVEELTLTAPLVIEDEEPVRLRVEVGEPDGQGRRPVRVLARPASPGAGEWTGHAEGTLAASAAPERFEPAAWPPPGAQGVPIDGLYEALADGGLGYGPAFRGLRAVWRLGDETFAEVVLPETAGADRFVLHPALLDAALHPLVLAAWTDGDEELRLPFSWSDVRIGTGTAATVRVRLARRESGEVAVTATDESGRVVIEAGGLTLRPLPQGRWRDRTGLVRRSAFRLDWRPVPAPRAAPPGGRRLAAIGPGAPGLLAADHYPDVPALSAALDAGAAPPDIAFLSVPEVPDRTPDAVRETTHLVLGALQTWLAEDRLSGARLVVISRDAVAAVPGDRSPGLGHAPLWGLLRSARSEHPGRFGLLDLDGAEESLSAVPAALAVDEPEIAVRRGGLHAPRLAPLTAGSSEPPALGSAGGTVLVTGATGGIGRVLTRHLVAAHGVRHLLLVGRRGGDGAAGLGAELRGLGAEVTFAACDVADRAGLAEIIGAVPADRPLTGVFHAAGVLEDAVLSAIGSGRLDRVLRPKLDGALWLHELTLDLPIRDFVLFSSASGVLGAPGQAAYAAANAFLDALARHRRAAGLPAVSLAWGPWDVADGMVGRLTATDATRLRRRGAEPLSAAEGMALFDAATAAADPAPVLMKMNRARPVGDGPSGEVPALLRELVAPAAGGQGDPSGASADAGTAPAAGGRGLADALAGRPAEEQEKTLVALIRGEAAATLGHPGTGVIETGRSFADLGFDSLATIELRNRLNRVTGLRLPASVLFDHPTPRALAARLRTELAPDEAPDQAAGGAAGPLFAELDRIEEMLGRLDPGDAPLAKVSTRLEVIATRVREAAGRASWAEAPDGGRPEAASLDELLAHIDEEFGAV